MSTTEVIAAAHDALRAARFARLAGDGAKVALWLDMAAVWRQNLAMMLRRQMDILPPA